VVGACTEPREEVYVTFSYAPVFGDGAVDGIFCACWETTQRLVGTRRLDTLRKLGVRPAEARTVAEACAATAVVLAENPHDVPFAAVYAVSDDGATADVRGMTGPSPGHTPDDGYRTFFDLVAGHLGTAFAEATAFEAERRRAEALTEMDGAKTAFFSNVSHEFRSPLTLMLAPLEEALASRTLAAEHREQLTTAHRSAARLLKLVNSLLDVARIGAGRVEAVVPCRNRSTSTATCGRRLRSRRERRICPPLGSMRCGPVSRRGSAWRRT
jgi:signal transduction histidine kinase